MYINRKIESSLLTWLQRPERQTLIVRGARQVGKSTLIREAVRRSGRQLMEVNVEEHLTFLKAAFDKGSVQEIISACARVTGLDLSTEEPNKVLFLDEIQALPSALTALRYLQEQMPEVPIVVAGSVLEFTLTDQKFTMPVGRVEYLYLAPLTFSEFLAGIGRENLAVAITKVVPWDPATLTLAQHGELLDLMRQYMMVGGMPAAVSAFITEPIETRWDAVARIHRNLLASYRDDIQKYPTTAHMRDIIREVFDRSCGIVGQKLKYVKVAPHEPARDVKKAVDLLLAVGFLQDVRHTDAQGIPLSVGEDPGTRKLYHLDIGLYLAQLGWRLQELKLWDIPRFVNEGALAEQWVAQSLLTRGDGGERVRSHYWLRERKAQNAELDFVIAHGHHIIPLEVKAGKSGTLRSLAEFCDTHAAAVTIRFDTNLPSLQKGVFTSRKTTTKIDLCSLPLYLVTQLPRILDLLLDGHL